MLTDDVNVTLIAGHGGNGFVHFKRNAITAKGGPDGGNGGNGGNIYGIGVDDIMGLTQFRFKKEVRAEDGIKGGRQNLFGRNGKDVILEIPLGTTITDLETQETWEITDTTTNILLVAGGHGGRGNNEFKTATNQTPTFAEPGTPGQIRKVNFVLRLIADIGFIGLPNAGKSSLLKALTNANPKIGNYPFTTLEPNLGVMPDSKLVLADIPGLIEGASKGKGLGTTFLKHVEKTKVLFHCIDGTDPDILATYNTVREELTSYSETLSSKKEVIVLTKADLLDTIELNSKVELLKKVQEQVIAVSIYDKESLQVLQSLIRQSI